MFEPLRPCWELLLVAVCKVSDTTVNGERNCGEYIQILESSGVLERGMSMLEVVLVLS